MKEKLGQIDPQNLNTKKGAIERLKASSNVEYQQSHLNSTNHLNSVNLAQREQTKHTMHSNCSL